MDNATKINRLCAGESVELSRTGSVRVIAERSGDGKRLTIVRITRDASVVIRREKF